MTEAQWRDPGIAALQERLASLSPAADDGAPNPWEAVSSALATMQRDLDTVTGAVIALRQDVDAMPRGIADSVTRAVTGAFTGSLAGAVGPLTDAVVRLVPTEDRLGDLGAAVEARLATLEDALAGVAERLEAFARDGASTTIERIAALSDSMGELHGSVGQLGAETEQARRLETSVSGLSEWLHAAVEDLAGGIEAGLSGLAGSVDASLAGLAGGDDLLALDPASVAEVVDGVTEAVGVRVTSALESLRAEVDRVAGTALAAPDLAELRVDLADALEEVRDRITADLGGAVAGVDAKVADMGAGAFTELEELRQATREELGLVSGAAAAMVEELRDQVANAVAETKGTTDEQLSAVKTTAEQTISTVRDFTVSTLEEMCRATTEELAEARTLTQSEMSATRERVVTELAALREAVAASLLEAGDSAGEELAALRESAQAEMSSLASRTQDVLREIAETADERADTTDGRVTLALSRLSEELRLSGEAVRASLSAQLDADLTVVAEAVLDGLAEARGNREHISAVEGRLIGAGRLLVDYLIDRDLALEAERDRVLHQLLEDVAAELSSAERRKLSARASALLERRRNERDAGRFRATRAGLAAPGVDEQELLDRLGLLDDPAAAVPPAVPEPLALPETTAVPSGPAASQRPAVPEGPAAPLAVPVSPAPVARRRPPRKAQTLPVAETKTSAARTRARAPEKTGPPPAPAPARKSAAKSVPRTDVAPGPSVPETESQSTRSVPAGSVPTGSAPTGSGPTGSVPTGSVPAESGMPRSEGTIKAAKGPTLARRRPRHKD